MTNNAITRELGKELYRDLENIESIDIIVSFIQLSGFKEIEALLTEASKRNIKVRVLTSTYLNITDPTALRMLYYLPNNVKTYLYTGSAPSFHPKAYFFYGKTLDYTCLFVGSSNLSKAALTYGIEWNYRIDANKDNRSILNFKENFDYLINNCSVDLNKQTINEYTKVYRYREEAKYELSKTYFKPENTNISNIAKPNPPQIEALLELKNTREEGNEKALVVAATGIGKTYLAAFDSKSYDRILFVAHREEILEQAYNTFYKVRGNCGLGKLYGKYREYGSNILFASVQTLSKKDTLEKFKPDNFSYICIDELHHGVADTYKRILEYFKPSFMLGLTATPYRLDQKDVYAICDYNHVYELDLFTSINRGWLVPYKYYGIYDMTVNYDNITYINGTYNTRELEYALMIKTRSLLILKHYNRYRRKRALAFCSSINHCEQIATFFEKNNIKCACVHSDQSKPNWQNRSIAIKKLKNGEIDIIFSVDMFNEGVDICELDLLLFLRPTESSTIFLQQLGRGLRKAPNKNDVRVLDFIGNYKKVDLIPFLLGHHTKKDVNIVRELHNGNYLPKGCIVDFEFEVIDLLEKTLKSRIKINDQITSWFSQCQESEPNVLFPSRNTFFNYLSEDKYLAMKKNSKFNPFKDYLSFVYKVNKNYVDSSFFKTVDYSFINFIETTSMSRLYKIPVIESFISNGILKEKVSIEEIIDVFISFYKNNRNRLDILHGAKKRDPNIYKRKDWKSLIVSNPIKYLVKTNSNFFKYENEILYLKASFDFSKKSKENYEFVISQIEDALQFRRNEFLNQRIEKYYS